MCHDGTGYTIFESSVNSDQMVSEKQDDMEPHCFPSACKYMFITAIQQIKFNQIWK